MKYTDINTKNDISKLTACGEVTRKQGFYSAPGDSDEHKLDNISHFLAHSD